jgi:hypothetical protein
VYDSKQYKIFHQQKKNELPFHFSEKSSSSKSQIPTDIARSQIRVDPKNLHNPLEFRGPINRLSNAHFTQEKVREKAAQELFSQQRFVANPLAKDDSRDTMYTLSSKYPSTHEGEGISRDTTYSSVPSEWSYAEPDCPRVVGRSDSSWKESNQSRSTSCIKSESFEYEDSLESGTKGRPISEILQKIDRIGDSKNEEEWWMNYVFEQLEDKGWNKTRYSYFTKS